MRKTFEIPDNLVLFLSFIFLQFPVFCFSQNNHGHHEHSRNNTFATKGSGVNIIDAFKRDNGLGEAIIIQRHRDDAEADKMVSNYIQKTIKKLNKISKGNHADQPKQIKSSGCSNLDFEDGNFNSWTGQTGTNNGYPAGGWVNGIVAGRHSIVSSGSDPYASAANPIPLPAPGGGTYSVKLGNDNTNYEAEQLIYTFTVQPQDTNFIYKYAVVLQDPAHSYLEQPYFDFKILDQSGNNISCSYQHYVAGGGLPGFFVSPAASDVSFKPWTSVGISLTSYVGQAITLMATTADCSQGAHFGYAYLDFVCPAYNVSPNIYCDDETSVVLSVPSVEPGMLYSWTTGETTPSITINPQLYDGSSVNCNIESPTSVGLCGFWYAFPIEVADLNPEFSFVSTCLTVSFTDESTIDIGSIQTWRWDFGDGGTSTSQNVTHSYSSSGTYNVSLTVTLASGCQKTIVHPVTLTGTSVSVVSTNLSCFGDNDGTATATATGSPPYTFTWSPNPPAGQGTNSVSGLSAGTWVVQVSDGASCILTDTAVITQPLELMATIPASTNITCFGGNNGTATASATGGTGAYSYLWNDPAPAQTTITASNLTAGPWTVQVSDANGCNTTASVTLTEPAQINATIPSHVNVSCNGGTDGSATALATGGTGTYTYLWNDPAPAQTTVTATMLGAGTYTVTVRDANSCQDTAMVTISQPTVVVASVTNHINVACSGGSDGSLTAAGSGGVATYSYLWSNGAATATISNQPAGTYCVAITDQNGCSDTVCAIIIQPLPLVATISNHTDVNCFSGTDGNATVLATGGSPLYQALWGTNPAQTSLTAGNLPAGNYCVTITDTHSCTDTACVTISQPTAVTAQISASSMVSCNGGNDGTATVTPGGGVPPYTYLWPNNQTSASATNLTDGIYTVTVKDSHNCSANVSVTVTEPSLLTATATATDNLCFGDNTGGAALVVSGGTPSYTFVWSNGNTTQNLSSVTSGLYFVTVYDSKTCAVVVNVTINQPSLVTALISSQGSVSCFGGSDGTATVSASGGTPAYTYSWGTAPAQTGNTATGLSVNTYTVTVTDVNLCAASVSVTITEPPVLTAFTSSTDVSCFNGSDGTIDLTVIGGTLPYTYLWSNNATTQDVSGLQAGSHDVVITDSKSCTTSVSTLVSQPTQLTAASGNLTNVSCYGGNDGAACVSVAGGTLPYSYGWSAGISMNQSCATGLQAGIISVTVSDIEGCIVIHSMNLTSPPEIQCYPSSDAVICEDGSATLSVFAMGGTPPFTYHWITTETTSSIIVSPDTNTTYSCYVTDANNCIGATQYIKVFISLPVNLQAVHYDSICPGDTAKIFLTAVNGIPPYLLTLDDGTIITTPYYVNLTHTSSIHFRVTDKCQTTDTTTEIISVYPVPAINVTADRYAGCSPLTVNFHENTPDVGQTYVWNFDNNDENNLSLSKNPAHTFDIAGSYDILLTVKSVDGCKIDTLLPDFITVYPLPLAKFSYNPAIPTIIKPYIEFTNLSEDYITNFWFFGDGDQSLMTDPDHEYKEIGAYTVTLEVVSDMGCRDTSIQILTIQDYFSLYAPTAFSPDKDTKNDMFRVFGAGIMEGTFRLIIYDRWGEKMFESSDIEKEWDGMLKGEKVKIGTYVWVVFCKDFQGNEKTASGCVTVIR